ncbi:VCBS repeat-containing protein [bacterium]|nr:VCBS repeat-containing protein [bacterium]
MTSRSTTVVATLLLLTCGLLPSCDNGSDTQSKGTNAGRTGGTAVDDFLSSSKLNDSGPGSGKFVLLGGDETGIEFDNRADDIDFIAEDRASQAGLACGDVNGDGILDLFLCGMETDNRLYIGEGGFRFRDVTADSGDDLAVAGHETFGALFVDIEGDGDQDLYLGVRGADDRLYINDGRGKFTNEASQRGTTATNATSSIAAFDVEPDGDLDLYVCSHSFDPRMTNDDAMVAQGVDINSIVIRPELDLLLINDGSGKFTDGTSAAGIDGLSWSWQAMPADYNDDGYMDLFVSSDYSTNDRYYINNGDGTFTDHATTMLRRTPWFSMGCDSGDINGDGRIDLFCLDMSPNEYKASKLMSGDMYDFRDVLVNSNPQQMMHNMLQLNRGQGWMTDISSLAGVKSSEWSWTARIADLDYSGIPELFVANGYLTMTAMNVDYQNQIKQIGESQGREAVKQFMKEMGSAPAEDVIFTADSPLDYKRASGNWGMTGNTIDTGTVIDDIDGDGDLDIIANQTNGDLQVWRNELDCGNFIAVELSQDGANAFGVGSKLTAYCGDAIFADTVVIGRGIGSGVSPRVHLGLGGNTKVDRLEIRWPDGKLQTEENLDAGLLWSVRRRDNLPDFTAPSYDPMFAQADMDFSRDERDTDKEEFAAELLLPIMRSYLGGGVGVADSDLDGDLDVYFAGAAGQSGRLKLNDGSGNLESSSTAADINKRDREEMAVLWFDANGDERPDLYISNGSMEAYPDSDLYDDVIVLNMEDGLKASTVPGTNISSGSVCAADIDGDGDQDLFVAGRQVPHRFALPATSVFLRNDGKGGFSVHDFSGGQPVMGCISDAQFADMDHDGDQDLVVCEEFGTVSWLANNGGSFGAKQAVSASGMWQSLCLADLNEDGNIDIVAGNWGQNTKYHPSAEKPYTMFAGDMEGDGDRDLIEAKNKSGGGYLPGRGRSCSGYAMPSIQERFPKWDDFANASFEDIYGDPSQLPEKYEAADLHNTLFMSDGNGGFSASQLPMMAQLSPVYGILASDFDGDGDKDLLLAENYKLTQPETGRWNLGYSTMLLQDSGNWTAVDMPVAGVNIHEDARGVVECDLDADGMQDIIVTVSNGMAKRLEHSGAAGGSFNVTLAGKAGNRFGSGAVIMLALDDGSKLFRLVQAGQGYMSSYVGPQHFAIPAGRSPQALEVTWSDGSTSMAADLGGDGVTVEQ